MSEAPRSVRAIVALSANLGDREATLESAVEELDGTEGLHVLRVSPWFETEPVGGPPGQPDYLNGALEVETTLSARELLERMLRIEVAHGRVRAGIKDGPRTLDLDLLFYGEDRIAEPGLIVPHPRLEERTFVLEPLARLAPNRHLAGCRRSVMERLAELRIRARRSVRRPVPREAPEAGRARGSR
ncbi:MAG: 2-amino-4-hydroxy-6-hydroxymethyldihydropteridine diphosphokinase [Planctomycetota bacterium]